MVYVCLHAGMKPQVFMEESYLVIGFYTSKKGSKGGVCL